MFYFKSIYQALILLVILLIAVSCDSNPYNCNLDTYIIAENDSLLNSMGFEEDLRRFYNDFEEVDLRSLESKSFRLSVSGGDQFTLKYVYRIEKTNVGATLTGKYVYSEEYKNQYNEEDTLFVTNLSQDQWIQIEREFNSRCFWTMPIKNDYYSPYQRIILEAYDPEFDNPTGEDYHIVGRSFPEDSSDFARIWQSIIELDPRN